MSMEFENLITVASIIGIFFLCVNQVEAQCADRRRKHDRESELIDLDDDISTSFQFFLSAVSLWGLGYIQNIAIS